MVYLAIILIPFILLTNAYLLGCFVKRWSISTNTYFCSTIGFFILISILFVVFVFLYISSSTIVGYLIFIAIIQILLIVGYIWNYRYIFLTKEIKWKPLVTFIAIVSLTCLISTVIIVCGYKMSNPMGVEFNNLINNFQSHDYYNRFDQQINFFSGTFNFQSFSVFSIIAVVFKRFLNIKNSDLNFYLYYQQVITFCFVVGWTVVGFAYKLINRTQWWYVAVPVVLALIIMALSTSFYEAFIVGDAWVSVPIILYCATTFNRNENNEKYHLNLNLVIVLGIAALDVNLTLLTIILLIFNFLYNSFKNFNTWGSVIYIFFPLLFVIFVWIPLSYSVVHAIILSLILIASILISIFYWRINNLRVLAKVNSLFNKHPFMPLIIMVVAVYFLSIILLVTAFNRQFDWVLWPKGIYENLWGTNLSKTRFNFGLNVTSWLLIILFTIGFIVYWFTKRFKLTDQPYLAIVAFSILLFANPLSLNIFSRLQQSKINLFDFGLINYLVIIPSLIFASNLIGNRINSRKERTLYEQSINQNQQSKI